jgi:hypothetical protein
MLGQPKNSQPVVGQTQQVAQAAYQDRLAVESFETQDDRYRDSHMKKYF